MPDKLKWWQITIGLLVIVGPLSCAGFFGSPEEAGCTQSAPEPGSTLPPGEPTIVVHSEEPRWEITVGDETVWRGSEDPLIYEKDEKGRLVPRAPTREELKHWLGW